MFTMVSTLHSTSTVVLKRVLSQPEVTSYLDLLRHHHKESYSHSMRVGFLSIDLGLDERLADEDLLLLGSAGLLHDIGKTKIPTTILAKRGQLDAQERTLMDEHPVHGFNLLEALPDPRIRQIVIAHHEYKPSPYPREGVERRDSARDVMDRRRNDPIITSLAQLVAVADLYDALASRRSYKPALPKPQIEQLLRTQFKGNQKYITAVLRR